MADRLYDKTYAKINKEEFEIVDWTCSKESNSGWQFDFRVKGNAKAARAMVNQRLGGIIGKYCVVGEESKVLKEVVEKVIQSEKDSVADMDARAARGKAGAMPGTTRDF